MYGIIFTTSRELFCLYSKVTSRVPIAVFNCCVLLVFTKHSCFLSCLCFHNFSSVAVFRCCISMLCFCAASWTNSLMLYFCCICSSREFMVCVSLLVPVLCLLYYLAVTLCCIFLLYPKPHECCISVLYCCILGTFVTKTEIQQFCCKNYSTQIMSKWHFHDFHKLQQKNTAWWMLAVTLCCIFLLYPKPHECCISVLYCCILGTFVTKTEIQQFLL